MDEKLNKIAKFDFRGDKIFDIGFLRSGYTNKIANFTGNRLILLQKTDKVIYIQCAYMLAEPETIEREYTPLETIDDNYEKFVVTLDDLTMPSNKGINHIQAWKFAEML
jgi:uncharacterized protein